MARVVKKYKNGGKEPTTPEEILAYALEKRKLEAELLEKYGSVRKIPENWMRHHRVFAFTDLPPLPQNYKPSDAEIEFAMDYYGVPSAKAKYNLAYPQFAPGGDQDPSTWGWRVENREEPFIRTIATTLSLAPVLGEVLDIINVPWVAATGTDMYTGQEMSTSEASAWAAGGLVIPNVLQRPTQWLVKQGAKNADDIKRIIQPHLKNIDNAPEDLKPLLQLQKKSSDLKAHLRQYDVPQGTDMGKGFKSSYDHGRKTSDAAADFLTQTNPNLVLQFSPSSFNKGMFDSDLGKWADAYLTSYRGVGAKNIDEAATFMRNPHGGALQQYGKGTYSTSHLPTATGYGGYVGAIRDMPNIGRSGQFGGDIIKDISNLEARGGSTKRIFGDNPQILRPSGGIYTSGDIVRVSRPETTIKSGILDVVPSSQGDDLLRYRSDFGGVGPFGTGGYGHPDTKRGMDEIHRLITEGNLKLKKKGGKINSYEKGGILQSMAKKNKSAKNKFVSNKVRALKKEGRSIKEAVAIALDMWNRSKRKNYGAGGSVSPMQDWGMQSNFTDNYLPEEPDFAPIPDPNLIPVMNAMDASTEGQTEGGQELTEEQKKQAQKDAALSGAAKGALTGAKFGPWGAVAGGIIGGAVGYFRSAKEGMKILKKKYDEGGLLEALRQRRAQRRLGRTTIQPNNPEYLEGAAGMFNQYLQEVQGVPRRSVVLDPDADDSVLTHELIHSTQYGPLQQIAAELDFKGAGRIQDKDSRKAFKKLFKSIDPKTQTFNSMGEFMIGGKEQDIEFDAIIKSAISSAKKRGYDLSGKTYGEILDTLSKARDEGNISLNMRHLGNFMNRDKKTGNTWTDEQKGYIMDAIKANLDFEGYTAQNVKQDLR